MMFYFTVYMICQENRPIIDVYSSVSLHPSDITPIHDLEQSFTFLRVPRGSNITFATDVALHSSC